MSIDPRAMSQLLRLQLLNSSSLLSGGTDAAQDSETDFNALLQSIMGQPIPGASMQPDSLADWPELNNENNELLPSSLLGLNKSYTPLQFSAQTGSTDYDSLIDQASSRFGVDVSLIKAVINQESSFDSQAVSSAGAKGLMQLMDGTARGLGVTDSFDAQQNVQGGTQYLANLLNKYGGNEGIALAAYNAGPGRVDRLGIRNEEDLQQKLHLLPKETQAYISKVLGLKQIYE
ncbi:lytic transglycosylase domain-containing protein [Paenibacillus eucommiae]|uniref:Soluble lytic murein transglycosylase-like protein n=1 Tax=Paenibacillus eucommiae TaxID=1355755 RepID=A0ABS4IZ11_9BACL|nr:lytic transglycosylase domain-containing protein [Paenibacillus eucommiae]MBP1992828.1 soluble lytic murein transglycosylase-like protein [Paenibacillus eucommiae]